MGRMIRFGILIVAVLLFVFAVAGSAWNISWWLFSLNGFLAVATICGFLAAVLLATAKSVLTETQVATQTDRFTGVRKDGFGRWIVVYGALFGGIPAAILAARLVWAAVGWSTDLLTEHWWLIPLGLVAASLVAWWWWSRRDRPAPFRAEVHRSDPHQLIPPPPQQLAPEHINRYLDAARPPLPPLVPQMPAQQPDDRTLLVPPPTGPSMQTPPGWQPLDPYIPPLRHDDQRSV